MTLTISTSSCTASAAGVAIVAVGGAVVTDSAYCCAGR